MWAVAPAEQASEDLLQQARLFVANLGCLVRQEVGVLKAIIYPIVVQVYEVMALLLRLLAKVATVTNPSLRRHTGEGFPGRSQVILVS